MSEAEKAAESQGRDVVSILNAENDGEVEREQDWENESTEIRFSDGSCLVLSQWGVDVF